MIIFDRDKLHDALDHMEAIAYELAEAEGLAVKVASSALTNGKSVEIRLLITREEGV